MNQQDVIYQWGFCDELGTFSHQCGENVPEIASKSTECDTTERFGGPSRHRWISAFRVHFACILSEI